VDKLFVFSRGEPVEKDGPLVRIYSPDLLTNTKGVCGRPADAGCGADQWEQRDKESTERLLESARQRLRLWNIGEAQIAELEKTRKPQELMTLHSPFKGIVQNLGWTGTAGDARGSFG